MCRTVLYGWRVGEACIDNVYAFALGLFSGSALDENPESMYFGLRLASHGGV